MIEKVQLAKTHVSEALSVTAGDESQAAVVGTAIVQMQPHIKHLLRHPKLANVPETVCVPAEARISAPGYIHVSVHDHTVLFVNSDPGIVTDQAPYRFKTPIGHQISDGF